MTGGHSEIITGTTVALAPALMRQTLEAYVEYINTAQMDALLALFTPDAVIEDPVGTPPKTGRAITDWFADTIAFGAHIRPTASIRGSHANAAALIFEVSFRSPDGQRTLIRSLDVCTFNPDGLITSLKAYWGTEDVEILPD